ncbi:hypothetical protein E3N88_00277 [Mikania micrantha]|uniref:Replication protein A 70 kDa DNA-binding subunit B/D first OB fold domain-containing protein n=1 Tax=Mikania micrantha TaxID=192012 RepID=A0A5N6PZL5_9ASTR|nr:hypothetical protein E3N88_00277 [Mikania micrantha]
MKSSPPIIPFEILRDLRESNKQYSEEGTIVKILQCLTILDVSIDDYIIKVRILRKWRQPDRKYPNEDYSIEMILIDEEGNKIQAHVLKKWFFRFENYLNENDCLLIKRPSLGINLSKYKFVDNPNKVNFNYQTYVSKCNDFKGQEHDVIGHIVKFFNKDGQSLNEEKNKTRITMQLHDLQGSDVFLTLWDHYANQLFNYMSKHKMDEHILIILQFARVKFFNGNPYVSNSFGSEVSKLFINDEFDDIKKYKKSLMKKAVDDPSSIQLPFGLSMFCSLQDEFLTNTSFPNIGEICEIIEVGTKYVTHFKEDESGDFEDEKVFECNNPKCNVKVVSPVPRFKIQIRVQDITGVVSLTLFDRDVTKLIQKTAREVLDDLNEVKTFIVDNMTPFSKVKCKLVDIYDLEDESSVCDKKLHTSVFEENNLHVASKTPLIVPNCQSLAIENQRKRESGVCINKAPRNHRLVVVGPTTQHQSSPSWLAENLTGEENKTRSRAARRLGEKLADQVEEPETWEPVCGGWPEMAAPWFFILIG